MSGLCIHIRIAFSSLSLLLMVGSVVFAQEKPPAAPGKVSEKNQLENVSLLFDKSGTDFIHSLAKHIYGEKNKEGVVRVTRDEILFSPTDSKDHLTIPYLATVPRIAGKKRLLRILFYYTEKSKPRSNFKLIIQKQQNMAISQIQFDKGQGEALHKMKQIELPKDASKIRFVLVSSDGRPTNLPYGIKLECGYSELDSTVPEDQLTERPVEFLFVFFLIIVVGFMIFTIFRKRSKKIKKNIPSVVKRDDEERCLEKPLDINVQDQEGKVPAQRSIKKKFIFTLISLTVGCFLAVVFGELSLTVYSHLKYGSVSVQELLDREKENIYVLEFFQEGESYLKSLFPHPYLGFVHKQARPYGGNNIGLLGHDYPIEKDESKFTILVTGGSVATQMSEGIGERVNFLKGALEKYDFGGREVVVLNGASGAWKHPQQTIMLVLYGYIADALINLDGFNEHYLLKQNNNVRLEYPASNFHRLNPIVETGTERLALAYLTSTLYAHSRKSWIITHSRLAYFLTKCIRNYIQELAKKKQVKGRKTTTQSLFSLPPDWSGDKRARFNMEQYKRYIRMMADMARQIGLKHAFFIQPVPAIGKTLTEQEKAVVGDTNVYRDVYQKMTDELLTLREEDLPIYSLLDVFESCNESLYADPIHCIRIGRTNDSKGYRLMAERIASILEKEWKLEKKEKYK